MKKLILILLLSITSASAAPNTTNPNVSNILSQCIANAPIVGNGAGINPICHASGALGTAAFINTGTSGGTLGLLNAANTWSATQSFAAMTATTHNGLTITTTTGTLTIANGKTATVNNTLTFTGTDTSSIAFGAGGTVAYSSSFGTGVSTALGVNTNSNGGFPIYNSGSWTPTVTTSGTVGTPSYSAQVGTYEQIGRLIVVRYSMTLSGWTGTPTGNVSIAGLPFTSANIANDLGICHITFYNIAGITAGSSLSGVISVNTNTILVTQLSNITWSNVTVAQFGTTSTVSGACLYHI